MCLYVFAACVCLYSPVDDVDGVREADENETRKRRKERIDREIGCEENEGDIQTSSPVGDVWAECAHNSEHNN